MASTCGQFGVGSGHLLGLPRLPLGRLRRQPSQPLVWISAAAHHAGHHHQGRKEVFCGHVVSSEKENVSAVLVAPAAAAAREQKQLPRGGAPTTRTRQEGNS